MTPRGWIARINHPDGWVRREAVRQWHEQAVAPEDWKTWLPAGIDQVAAKGILLQWLANEDQWSAVDLDDIVSSPDPRLRALLASLIDANEHSVHLVKLLRDADAGVRRSAIESAFASAEVWNSSLGDAVVEAVTAVHHEGVDLPSLATESVDNQGHLAKAIIGRPSDSAIQSLVHQAAQLFAYRADLAESSIVLLRDLKPSDSAKSLTVAAAIVAADRLRGRVSFDPSGTDADLLRRLDASAELLADAKSVVADHALTWIAHRPAEHTGWLRRARQSGSANAFASAVQSLSKLDAVEHADWCADNATGLAYAELQVVVDAALRSDAGRRWFIHAIEQDELPMTLTTDARWQQIFQSKDVGVVASAKRLQATIADQRQNRLATFVSVIDRDGSVDAGREQFRKHCAACHIMEDFGTQVGPDISDSRDKSKRYLLEAIVEPSASIDAGFIGHQVLTSDGEIVQGLVVSQTEQAITLRTSGGVERSFAVDELEVSRTQTTSLMPAGFDAAMTPTQMNDLLHYLKNWRGDTYVK